MVKKSISQEASIRPWEDRPGHFGDIWMYWTDDGLGYFEFLKVGICHTDQVDTSAVSPFVQEALDSIEFARSDPNSTWGSVRTAMGHPDPFDLRLLVMKIVGKRITEVCMQF
ncbi:hypothetical protein WN943_022644 [Citrus x changshan-huyou]